MVVAKSRLQGAGLNWSDSARCSDGEQNRKSHGQQYENTEGRGMGDSVAGHGDDLLKLRGGAYSLGS